MSFRLKIVLGIVLIQALLLVILITISLNFLRVSNEIELSMRANSLVSLYSVALADAVVTNDRTAMLDKTKVIAGQPGVSYARMLFAENDYIEMGNKHQLARPFVEDFLIEDVSDGVFDVYTTIYDKNGEIVGRVEIGLSILQISIVMDAARRQISTIAIIGMAFSVLMAILLGNYFARQLKSLRDASRSIASGNIGFQMHMRGEDELAQTADAFNTMSRKLALLYSEKQAALNESVNKALIMREKERRLKAILENAGDGIITIDNYGDIESFNPAAERMFGYLQSEVIGENVSILIDETFAKKHDGDLTAYLKHKERPLPSIVREIIGSTKDRKTFFMEIDVSEMQLEGQQLYIAIVRDITERKRAEDELRKAQGIALESARAKFEFIGNISHEIRTPMNGVLTMINLLNDSELTDEQKSYVNVIHESGSALITIINDVLDFSRLEAGQLALDFIEFDLEQMIEDVCHLLHANAISKDLSLVYIFSGDVPTALIGDPARLRQILINLVDNAIKYTQEGCITVEISVVNEQNDNVALKFSVVDTGKGLTPRAQRCLSDGADENMSYSSESTLGSIGLGLAISQKLLKLMDSKLVIESEQGNGSTFSFTVNFRCQSRTVTDKHSHYSQLHGLNVLVIDSREVWSGFLKEQMESIDMSVSVASDCEQGLMLLRSAFDQDESFDLVIFDMMIPGTSGLELARQIREDDRAGQARMIMIATTGYRGDSEEVRRVGITGYLSTPVSSSQLYDCISAVMIVDIDDNDTLITRHSLADTRASHRDHVLVILKKTEDQKKLVSFVQSLSYRVHFIVNVDMIPSANRWRHYHCILVDCRDLSLANSQDRLMSVSTHLNDDKDVNIVALVAADECVSIVDYQSVGIDEILKWPVQVKEFQKILKLSA